MIGSGDWLTNRGEAWGNPPGTIFRINGCYLNMFYVIPESGGGPIRTVHMDSIGVHWDHHHYDAGEMVGFVADMARSLKTSRLTS